MTSTGMFSCTNALAQTIGALRKQDWHHPNTPDITQTIQALNKQSFPHLHLSFPRRRESIVVPPLASVIDRHLCGGERLLGHIRAPTRMLKQAAHDANGTGTIQ